MKLLALVVFVAALSVSAAFVVTSGSAAAKQRHRAACPSAARIKSLPRWTTGGLLRADVNGDKRPDAVSIRFDKRAPARCAFYLRVATHSRQHTLKLGNLIAGFFGKSEWNAPVHVPDHQGPAVEAIVDLGGHGNLVVLLDGRGAADEFVDFFGLSRKRLRLAGMSLDLGGSVMSQSGASCSRGGPLREWHVWSTSAQNRWGFSVTRYRRHGWQFRTVGHHKAYGSEKKVWRAARRAGSSRGLAGCSLARNPSFTG
jgi:hypothetical protein